MAPPKQPTAEQPAAPASDVWLPMRPEEIEGLPTSLRCHFWDGAASYPADPSDCAFYVLPYMRDPDVVVRPLRLMPGLRVVQTLTAGIDHVAPVLPELPPGVRVCNAKGVHEASTAELALTLTLASLRGVPEFVAAQRSGDWLQGIYPALADRRVLIVGYGAIGAAVEERLVPFEVAEVLRVARTTRTVVRGAVHSLSALPEMLPRADVVILCTPLSETTRGLVDTSFLARMRDGALLVNVARGGVVDTDALLAELTNGRIRAALDVTDPEPLPSGHPLWQAPNVLISPHVGGATSAMRPRAVRLLKRQLTSWANGERLENVVHLTD